MTPAFIDTGAWFARFVQSDRDHATAHEWFEHNQQPLVTTDYIVDELLTLLKIRGEFARALEVGPPLLNGDLCKIEWVLPADVELAWRVFHTYRDKDWSFTDCVSRVVMERLHITTAVSFDDHFRQFGTVRVLP